MKILLIIILYLLNYIESYTQEKLYSKSTMQVGVGVGGNVSNYEFGVGTKLFVGYQLFIWRDRLRVNPHAFAGNFRHYMVRDASDYYYRLTTAGVNLNFDAIKYKPFAFFLTAGGFVNYSRGLNANNGMDNMNSPRFFHHIYYGGAGGFGIRLSPPKSRVVYELIPINIYLGNNGYGQVFTKFGIDIKLNKTKKQ